MINPQDAPDKYEFKFYKKNGEIKHALMSITILSNQKIIASFLDITERKKAEEDLKRSTEQYRITFENTGSATVLIEEDATLSLVNTEFEHLSGYSKDEIEGKKKWTEFVVKEDLEYMQSQHKLRRKRDTAAKKQYEFRFVDRSGAVHDILLYIDVIKETKKSVASLLDITDRKRAEESIRNSEMKLRSILDATPFPIALVDIQDDNIAFWSHSALTLFGHTAPTAGEWYQIAYPDPDYRREVIERWKPALEKAKLSTQPINTGEYRVTCRDGSIRICELYATFLADSLIVTFNDITGRKQAEEAQLKSEEKFRGVFENSTIGKSLTSTSGKLLKINQAFANMLGYSIAEMEELNFEEITYPDDIAESKECIRCLSAEEKSTYRMGKRYFHKNGTIVWAIVSTTLFRDSNNVPLYLITSIQDITERKQAEEQIRQSEEKYKNIFENIQDVYYEISVDGTILIVSPSIFVLSKGLYRSEDLIGRNMFDYYPDPERRKILLQELKKTGRVEDFEIVLKNRDGSYVPCSLTCRLMFDENNQPWKIIGNIGDKTERKLFEQELIRAKDKAEESDRLKSAFLANMSHEIRTPLNAIVGFSSLFSDQDLSQEERAHFSSIIKSRSDDLLYIINDVLEISRIESGNATVVKEQVRLNDILDEMEEDFRLKLLQVNKANLQLICQKVLPTDQSSILTDKNIIKRVFSNLIDNAIKFTESGTIRFGYHMPDNQTLTCYISDTGIGISAENQELIFEHFRQATIDKPQKLYGGTGLGLSICKGALALLGGKIWVESVPAAGSTFYFTIPFEQTPAQKAGPVQKSDERPAEVTYYWAGKKLFLVEDDQTNMDFLTFLLKHTGTELVYAFSGKEVRQQFDRLETFDLVLLDIRLADADGWDLAREIKTLRPGLPVIAQTAYAMSTDRQKSEEVGCDGYISKPIRKSELFKIIAEFMPH
jgi:two-component system CheB/CheR fusion protein